MAGEGIILESRSWEKGGEAARQEHLTKVVEAAGLEVKPEPEAELPEPPAELNENLSPREAFEKNVTAYGAQIEQAKAEHPDWDELKKQFEQKGKDVDIGEATQRAILQQANGAEVTYYLMRNPDYARKLGRMCRAGRGVDAVTEIASLSARLGNTTYTAHASATPRKRPPENATFEQIVKAGPYWGRARDIRRALRRR